MFYSHPSLRLEFILFAVLSTHFLLHQYFISSLPLSSLHLLFTLFLSFFSLLFTSFCLFFLSCFCAVDDIYNHSDLLRFFSLPLLFHLSLLLCFPFSSFIWSLLCFRLSCSAPEVCSADEPKLFVVGGARLFLSPLAGSRGAAFRHSLVPGCSPALVKKKKLLLCLQQSRRHSGAHRIESEADAAVWSHVQRRSSVDIDLNSWFIYFIFLYQHAGKHRILGDVQEEVEISPTSVFNPPVTTQLLITWLCGGNKSVLGRSSQTSDPLTV